MICVISAIYGQVKQIYIETVYNSIVPSSMLESIIWRNMPKRINIDTKAGLLKNAIPKK